MMFLQTPLLAILLAPLLVLSSIQYADLDLRTPNEDGYDSLANNETAIQLFGRDLPIGTCNKDTPCPNGACCGDDNLCGYTDKQCGKGCRSHCDAKAQCGPYAAQGKEKCPLNVCCSEFGFCGSTTEFCEWTNKADSKYSACSTSYGGCGKVNRPSCGGGNSVSKRSVGYYESWANTRACQKVSPEDLNLDGFTSINFAFAFFDASSFEITPMDANGGSLYSRFTALKSKKPGLQAFISIGGWSFTDPGATQKAFSNMVSSQGNRAKFIKNVMSFMSTYGFDGADLDWEYPGADDRGGVPADTANYVSLCKEMSAAFGSKYQLTVTIPTSYWYLQHFDVAAMQDSISWYNLMAYDLHGIWDAQSKFLGDYIAPHTNITEIDLALDLLWRAGVKPDKVVMGQGWYGRSFTLADASCDTPNGKCKFTKGANPGPCSKASGILDYQEIADIIKKDNLKPVHDEKIGVKYITWDNDQWVSYDDGETFKQKRDFANSRCLGGLMVWAMDQVDQTADNGFGGSANSVGVHVTPDQQSSADQSTADQQAKNTCYTEDCGASCKPGTTEVAQFNGQPGQLSTNDRCKKKKYRSLCCDDKTQVGTCTWRGYRGAGLSCTSGCQAGETELATNTNQHTKKGNKDCHGGLQSYCCAGFKPTTSNFKQDLEDAAKAAAKAAAEQAALDIAAKAFCRLAVPALLAPLELLEDAIPIIGEIADIAEIAATPAIIQGCVKGIEKEGKSTFKVFGKSHTIKMGEPAEKPPDVPARGKPKDHPDPKQGNKDDPKSCKPKRAADRVKRVPAAVPTEDVYSKDTLAFTALKSNSPYKNNADWKMSKDGQGFAMKQTFYTSPSNPQPPHAIYIVGYVSISYTDEPAKNQCGETEKVLRFWRRDFPAWEYDLQTTGPLTGGGACQLGPYSGGSDWAAFGKDRTWYTYLGRVRPGYTMESVESQAAFLIKGMGPYNPVNNNCFTFVQKIYNAEKL